MMIGNGRKSPKTGWKGLEKAGGGWKQLEMAGNWWKLPIIVGNICKCLENGKKKLQISGKG